MLNLIEKLHALLVSEDIRIWHFPCKTEDPKFFYWLDPAEPDNKEGYGFSTFEEMIEAAYARIDPLLKPLPKAVHPPSQAEGAGKFANN